MTVIKRLPRKETIQRGMLCKSPKSSIAATSSAGRVADSVTAPPTLHMMADTTLPQIAKMDVIISMPLPTAILAPAKRIKCRRANSGLCNSLKDAADWNMPMAKKSTKSKYVKVEVRPASHILKVILILLILFSIVALVALRWVHNGILTQIDELKDEASGLEYANEVLDQKTEELGSVQSIQDIAEEELGLVDPDTILIDLD